MNDQITFLNAAKSDAVIAIADLIGRNLKSSKSVLWLISGGSNIDLEVAIMSELLRSARADTKHLTIIPMDERYGSFGHKDSNSEALRVAHFDPGYARWIDVLKNDLEFEPTVSAYDVLMDELLRENEVIVGQFGIGSDGHTAGIKPSSPASRTANVYVIGYRWSDFVRMTMSINALRTVTDAYVLAYGADKRDALQTLQDNASSLETVPSLLFYSLPRVIVYTDQII